LPHIVAGEGGGRSFGIEELKRVASPDGPLDVMKRTIGM
jgi:hypothetical protein